jgi:cytidylate kinase
MYRALTLKALDTKIDLEDARALEDLARTSRIELDGEPGALRVRLDGRDVSAAIRENRISTHSHFLARTAGVRRVLVEKQREFAALKGGVVTEGRDQGTVVFPNADVKFFLDAEVEERARRRQLELESRGEYPSFREILAEVVERDRRDSTRAADPLRAAEGAVHVDTTGLDVAGMIEALAEEIGRRVPGGKGAM